MQFVAGNYYPIDAGVYINDYDRDLQLTLLPDRSCAGASLSDGELEVMVHRRLLVDDGRGVGEPLNESTIIRTTQQLSVDTIKNSAEQIRKHILLKNHPVQLAFGPAQSSQKSWTNNYKTSFSPLKTALPYNLHLLSFDFQPYSWNGETFDAILRLHNIYAIDESAEPVSVDIMNLFSELQVRSVVELGLTATVDLDEIHRLQWNTEQVEDSSAAAAAAARMMGKKLLDFNFTVVLQPLQIRTFQVTMLPMV